MLREILCCSSPCPSVPVPLAVPDPPDGQSLATCLLQDLVILGAGGRVRSRVHTFWKIAFPSILFPTGSSACLVTVCNTTTAYSISPRGEKCTIKPSLWSLPWCLSLLCSSEVPNLDGLATRFCVSNRTLGYPRLSYPLASCLPLFIALYAGLLLRVTPV